MEDNKTDKLQRAKKRVDELKGFYIHLAVYLVINAFILVNVFISKSSNGESFWEFSTFFTAIFWGVGLVFHWANVFNYNPFFGKAWEEKQIQKYIEKDKEESNKYR
ncbi:2TM domain-containing protein [Eudoraea sp.]|uniref:2TM domain-containing protein n=1 Tax=Eudoraea sp. TaxID=1979955 RepID=UPI003C757C81